MCISIEEGGGTLHDEQHSSIARFVVWLGADEPMELGPMPQIHLGLRIVHAPETDIAAVLLTDAARPAAEKCLRLVHGGTEGRIAGRVDDVESGGSRVEESTNYVDCERQTCNGACEGL